MSTPEEFRFKSHELLVELDGSTTALMMLVVAGRVTGTEWCDAVERHAQACSAWSAFLSDSAPS